MIYYKNYDQIVKKITDGYEFGNVYDYRTNTEIKAQIFLYFSTKLKPFLNS